MNRSGIVWGFFVASMTLGTLGTLGASGVACGGNTPPADGPATSASAPASSAPVSDVTPATPDPATSAATPAPSADPPPAAPPPVDLPPAFVAAQTSLFAFGDRLNDAINGANGDCAKMGTALNKVASDAGFSKAFKGYITEVLKLSPAQRDAAKTTWEANQKKSDSMMDPIKACEKNATVKAATAKIKKILTDNMKPLLEALTGAMAGGSTAAPPPKKK